MKYDVKLENDHLKDVYKLLKQDLNDFYKDDNEKIICSFHIKHMLFTFRDKIGLQTDKLSHCYLKSLETLIEAIKIESLPMFFIPDVNLLENKFDNKKAKNNITTFLMKKFCKMHLS